MVQELTSRIGERQNLVSYHLGKLRDAGLVSARRSSADGRDSYYAVDLARVGNLISATGAALHPGLRLAMPSRSEPVQTAARLLFLCSGNSARSQMAEALARTRSGGTVEAYSAGSQPKPLHANALRVMREDYAIDLTSHTSKHLSRFVGQPFAAVVTLCDRVREVCPEFPDRPETIHWSIPDPAAGRGEKASYPRFRQTARELDARVAFLLARLADRIHTH